MHAIMNMDISITNLSLHAALVIKMHLQPLLNLKCLKKIPSPTLCISTYKPSQITFSDIIGGCDRVTARLNTNHVAHNAV